MNCFGRVFVANRGEIAKRVITTCRRMGIETVLGASACDLVSWPAMMADHVVCIGPSASVDSYLRIDAVLTAALATGCDAVHPGYGFLAENADFARRCAEEGLTFIGPRPDLLRIFGDKVASRELAQRADVPVLPGSSLLQAQDDGAAAAEGIGYPVLIKAASGGGGKGMHVAHSVEALASALPLARSEARAAFNHDGVFLERYVRMGRHVEVQVLGDGHGRYVHLGDRDCSVQRRHQKLIEEAPAPQLPEPMREQLHAAAVRLCEESAIDNAATVEFLCDGEDFYFLEVNPRIQVEHGVTECITGLDIVELQLRIASEHIMPINQDDVRFAGHAVQARINAEDPVAGFRPSPGTLACWQVPRGSGVRVDSHCYLGYTIPPFYDSLMAKVIAHGADRTSAINALVSSVQRLRVSGVQTTQSMALTVLNQPAFRDGRHTTTWLEEQIADGLLEGLA